MSRDVGVGQLVDDLEARGDRLPFEIGAFVALEACEGLLQESVRLEADDVRVTLDGAVLVSESAERVEPDEAAKSLTSVLARLLVAAGPGVPPHLLQLVKESTTGQSPRNLRHLHDAIEASLIPINRGASRRVLARLVRESDRPPAPDESAGIDPEALDAELDELLRDPSVRDLGASAVEPAEENTDLDEPVTERIRIPRAVAKDPDPQPETVRVPTSEPARRQASLSVPDLPPPPPPSQGGAARDRRPISPPPPEPVTATIRKWQPAEDAPPPAKASVSESVYVSVSESAQARPPELETASESVFGTGTVSAPPPERPSQPRVSRPPSSAPEERSSAAPAAPLPPRRGGWGIWLLAAAVGLGAYALIASGTLQPLFDRTAAPPAAADPGVIEVAVNPDDAQVFVFVGRGPASAGALSVGAAHEFVVLGAGLRPTGASVPAGATWPEGDNGSLYELAVQAQPAAVGEPTGDLGELLSGDASASATGTDKGTVRVVTNPPGAKVYRFVGAGPFFRIPVASIHEGQELLVHRAGHEIERRVVGPSDWETMADGAHRAKVAIDLRVVSRSPAAQPVED